VSDRQAAAVVVGGDGEGDMIDSAMQCEALMNSRRRKERRRGGGGGVGATIEWKSKWCGDDY
jgi:hypothetical protein